MSLIHWWPLTGDLYDRVGGKIFSDNGWTQFESGKIGKCYNCNNGKIATVQLTIPDTFSFACWVKNNDLTYPKSSLPMKFSNGSPYSSATAVNKGWEFCHSNTSTWQLTLNDGTKIQTTSSGSTSAQLSKWFHIAVAVDFAKQYVYYYINGVLQGSRAVSIGSFSGTYTLSIGQIYGWCLDGYLNDLRIYDHALSKTEVKELARAKVLHYTFDDDLACGTTNEAPISGWSTYGSYWTLLERTSNGLKIQRANSTANTIVAIQNSSLKAKMASGDTWTFSCYLYKNGQPYKSSCTEISSPTSYYYKTQSWESREDGYYRNTFKITNTPGDWMLHNNFFGTDAEAGIQYEMRYIQFEKRDFATPYASITRERSLANEAGYVCTNSANDVTFTENSKIGQRAIYCKEGLQRISATVPYLTTDVLSTSVWFKSSNTSPKNGYHIVFTVDSGRVEISVPSSGNLRWGGYNIVSNGSTQRFCGEAAAGLLDGKWHLLTTVYDGTGWLGYVDGVYKGKQTQTTVSGVTYTCSGPIALSNKKAIIGRYYDDATSNYGATDAYIDDVRIYNSVLTVDDIKDIYNVGMYITKSGDFIANNFVERSAGNMVATSDWIQEGIQDANGASAGTMTNRLATKYIPVLPNTEYYYAANSGINVRAAHYYTKDLVWIKSDQPTKNSFTAVTPDNCAYVRFVIQYSTASNNIPIANVNTYGATMRPAQFNEQLPLTIKTDAKVGKNCAFTCLDVCEGHSPRFLGNGKATAGQIIEN